MPSDVAEVKPPPEPTEIIAEGNWEQALFTTYALSLTFFESVVLRRLRAAGCREIWILADAEGYRASLMERRSSRVGQEYRLLPVALPRGVFHPKCSYLSGPDGDLLLVGSGNLTFGGFGRNIEVLDVLAPIAAPGAFRDFAQFLEALSRRPDFLAPDRTWATTFAGLARRAAATSVSTPVEQPKLLYTVERPILDQLVEACAPDGPGRRLSVLSPFHDSDGAAVRSLADRIGCSTIAVGLSPQDPSSSPFPFKKAKSWPQDVEAVVPVVPDDDRQLHAKWIEIDLATKTLVLTGSVNATSKSLCTNDNIEVGVLRQQARGSNEDRWTSVAIPGALVAPPRRAAGLGGGCLLHAAIHGDGALVGRLLATFDPSGLWIGALSTPAGDRVALEVPVQENGGFRVAFPDVARLAFTSGLQIEIVCGDHVARGWVHQEEVLRMPRLQRLGITSLLRLINREETEEDDVALLDYFAMSASRHLATFGRSIHAAGSVDAPEEGAAGAPQDASEARDANTTVSLSDLAPDSAPGTSAVNPASGVVAGEEQSLQRVLSQLRRRLVSQPALAEGHGEVGPWANAELGVPDEDGEEHGPSIRRVESALEVFDREMRVIVDDAATAMAQRTALVMWFEVTMHMLLRRLRDRSQAAEFLQMWFQKACSERRLTSPPGALEEHVFTAAALCPLVFESFREEQRRSVLHEALESFSGGDVDRDAAMAALIIDPLIGFAGLLLDGRPGDLTGSLAGILATKTLRRELQEALEDHRHGRPLSAEGTLFNTKNGAELRAALTKPSGRRWVREARGDARDACAHCFVAFTATAELDLLIERVAKCTACSKLTIRVSP